MVRERASDRVSGFSPACARAAPNASARREKAWIIEWDGIARRPVFMGILKSMRLLLRKSK
jgi:hypothetical protein|tara:strand:- start:535 stop:717 length:183 start_codon:yes stop_codon:yes gene_type:complete